MLEADLDRTDPERAAFARVVEVTRAHRERLYQYPGVLSVRPGYRFVNGRITSTPAVVVTVQRKRPLTRIPPDQRIPKKLDGVWVDVAPASPAEQIQAQGRTGVESAVPGVRALEARGLAADDFDWERAVLTGEVVSATTRTAARAIEGTYEPPTDLSLDEVRVSSATCHASPDAGWPLLRRFLAGVRERLTVAMYDFHADHILEVLREALRDAPRELRLILDRDGGSDRTEEEFLEVLRQALGDGRLEQVWASAGGSGAIFETAYHSKIVVRDGSAVWLSSGNWTRSGQPDIEPITFPSQGNREWHVILESAELAGTLEGFIRYDIEKARERAQQMTRVEPGAMPDLLVPEEIFLQSLATPPFSRSALQVFAPETFTDSAGEGIRVQPLLTPDNYIDAILELIDSAEEKLYLQYSYIRFPRVRDKFFELVDLVRRKTQSEVDVRIIVSERNQKREHTEQLRLMGYDMSRFRLQPRVHNKGILVDGRVAVVGSHNWSQDGVLTNRDASLVFHDRPIAQYYERIFLHDWNNLADSAGTQERAPLIAEPGAPTPLGMVRVPWRAFFEE